MGAKRDIKKDIKKDLGGNLFDFFDMYSESEIYVVIKSLNKEFIYILKKRYGNDYTNETLPDNAKNEDWYMKLYMDVLPTMRKKLEYNASLKESKKEKVVASIYNYFNTFNEEEVDTVINSLSDDEKELLKLKYGNDLHNPIENNMFSRSVHNYSFEKLLLKIKYQLDYNRQKKFAGEVLDLLNEFKREDVFAAIKKLEKNEIMKRRMLCDGIVGHVPSNEEIILLYKDELLPVIRKTIYNFYPSKEFYSYLTKYSKSEIDAIYNNLSTREKEVLKAEVRNSLFLNIINNIEIMIDEQRRKASDILLIDFYVNFSGFTKEQVNTVLKSLNTDKLDFIKYRFGDNFERTIEPEGWNEELQRRLDTIIVEIKKELYILFNKTCKSYKSFFSYFKDSTEEEVMEELNKLSNDEKQVIYFKHGNDFERNSNPEGWDEFYLEKYIRIVHKLQRKLKNHDILIKTIYEYFPNRTKNQIQKAIHVLPVEDQKLLYFKYGKNFRRRTNPEGWTQEHENKLNYLIKKMEQSLSIIQVEVDNSINMKSFYSYFPNNTKNEINKVFKSLLKAEKNLIKTLFGENLDKDNNPCKLNNSDKKLFKMIIAKFEQELICVKFEPFKKIYNYFPEYSKKEVMNIFHTLEDDEKRLLKFKYGLNFNRVSYPDGWTLEHEEKFNKIITKMKEKSCGIEKKEIRSFYSYFPEYNKEEVDEIFKSLIDFDKKIIYFRFGENFERTTKPEGWNIVYSRQFYRIVENMRNRLFNLRLHKVANEENQTPTQLIASTNIDANIEINESNQTLSIQSIEEDIEKKEELEKKAFIKLFHLPMIMDIINASDYRNAFVISMKLGYFNNKYYSNKEIAKFYSISEEKVKEIIDTFSESFKARTGKAIDEILNDETILSLIK